MIATEGDERINPLSTRRKNVRSKSSGNKGSDDTRRTRICKLKMERRFQMAWGCKNRARAENPREVRPGKKEIAATAPSGAISSTSCKVVIKLGLDDVLTKFKDTKTNHQVSATEGLPRWMFVVNAALKKKASEVRREGNLLVYHVLSLQKTRDEEVVRKAITTYSSRAGIENEVLKCRRRPTQDQQERCLVGFVIRGDNDDGSIGGITVLNGDGGISGDGACWALGAEVLEMMVGSLEVTGPAELLAVEGSGHGLEDCEGRGGACATLVVLKKEAEEDLTRVSVIIVADRAGGCRSSVSEDSLSTEKGSEPQEPSEVEEVEEEADVSGITVGRLSVKSADVEGFSTTPLMRL
ncbi:hypothetical protein BC829DRAFT_424212 [Chytridium lagenaria]|nr:hypothetical protein BC829DRAFT_424212 [Chytridium lagenaria]